MREYLLSLPERALRSMTGLSAGLLRELSELALPRAVRRTRLYRELVESTLRFLIENVGQVEGAYPAEGQLADDFAMRRFAGNGIELIGLLTFRASPVWVLAALADLSGTGRQLIREISQSLKTEGLLDRNTEYETIDQMLDGLEGTAGRLAETANTPPLDVASLRKEWEDLRREVKKFPGLRLPSGDVLRRSWEEMNVTAAAQGRSVFQVSSLMAMAAVARVPENLLWLSRCARGAARRTGQMMAEGLLEHYRGIAEEIRATGYVKYWIREFRPYLKAAVLQFSPKRISLTQRMMRKG